MSYGFFINLKLLCFNAKITMRFVSFISFFSCFSNSECWKFEVHVLKSLLKMSAIRFFGHNLEEDVRI